MAPYTMWGAVFILGEGMKDKQTGLSGSQLKIIALLAMILDHIGAILVETELIDRGVFTVVYSQPDFGSALLPFADKILYCVWWVLRIFIGRSAFPIFSFLLVEGKIHTHNVSKYILNLFVFGLLSEIPFDLAIYRTPFYFNCQNIFFTLLIGLVCMCGFDLADNKFKNRSRVINITVKIIITALGVLLGFLFKTDYSGMGVLFILLLYAFRNRRKYQVIFGSIGSILILQEITAPLAFLFINRYNGKRGFRLKYFFYLAYPVHLLILYFIAMLI